MLRAIMLNRNGQSIRSIRGRFAALWGSCFRLPRLSTLAF
jgi:hypothetical protein